MPGHIILKLLENKHKEKILESFQINDPLYTGESDLMTESFNQKPGRLKDSRTTFLTC